MSFGKTEGRAADAILNRTGSGNESITDEFARDGVLWVVFMARSNGDYWAIDNLTFPNLRELNFLLHQPSVIVFVLL